MSGWDVDGNGDIDFHDHEAEGYASKYLADGEGGPDSSYNSCCSGISCSTAFIIGLVGALFIGILSQYGR